MWFKLPVLILSTFATISYAKYGPNYPPHEDVTFSNSAKSRFIPHQLFGSGPRPQIPLPQPKHLIPRNPQMPHFENEGSYEDDGPSMWTPFSKRLQSEHPTLFLTQSSSPLLYPSRHFPSSSTAILSSPSQQLPSNKNRRSPLLPVKPSVYEEQMTGMAPPTFSSSSFAAPSLMPMKNSVAFGAPPPSTFGAVPIISSLKPDAFPSFGASASAPSSDFEETILKGTFQIPIQRRVQKPPVVSSSSGNSGGNNCKPCKPKCTIIGCLPCC